MVHVITNPTPEWKGYGGFITAGIIRAELSDPSDWTYYVVGPPPMITAMDKVLEQLEIPQGQIVVESFAGLHLLAGASRAGAASEANAA